MDTRTQQINEQNMTSGEITKNANIMGQPKCTPLIEHQSTPISSSENLLKPTSSLNQPKSMTEPLKPSSLEHQLKPSPEKLPKEDLNKNLANVEDLNKAKKVNSWASNYLHSIGHNNIKPIKIPLSSAKNKLQRIETISTSNEPNKTIAQPTLLKGTTSLHDVFNMTDNPYEFNKPNEKIIGEHIHIGNIKTLHPTQIKYDVHPKLVHAFPRSNEITSTPVNSNIVLDTVYTNNNNNSKAPAFTSFVVKEKGVATYCYSDSKREIDILDAIKSKIDHESVIEKTSRMMNLPTHKDMCEEFIKEISCIKPSVSEKKYDRSKSSTPGKQEEVERYNKKHTPEKLVKKDKKESLKTISKTISNKERAKKSKSASGKDKAVVKEKTGNQLDKNKQSSRPIVDINDFDILTEHIFAKEVKRQPKTESHSPERKNLKRVHTSSEDEHKFSSEIHTKSPIRSVVKVAENGLSNSPKRQCLDESFDLRSKLSRVNQRIHRKQMENNSNTKPKLRENLKITVENQSDEKQKSPKKSSVMYKTNKCKKLKLIINVVCQESDDEATSSDSSNNEPTPTHNMDLSFLDDFNVDEIVDCLKHSPNKHRMKSPLVNDNKMEENTKTSAEPELKLATILNILHAKSETNKLKSLVKTECKIDETIKINSSPILNLNKPITVPDVKMNNVHTTDNTNTTHALLKILSQTKLELNQQNTIPLHEVFSEAKYNLKTEETNVSVINTQEEKHSDDNNKLIIDESVIINEQEISIIDLTDEALCAASETNNKTITAIPLNCIPSKKPCSENNLVREKNIEVNNQPEKAQKDENENFTNEKIQNNLKEQNNKVEKTVYIMDVDVENATMDKNNESIIDLTNETIKNANTQMDIENEIIMKQEINLIPLPNIDITSSKENEEPFISNCINNDTVLRKETSIKNKKVKPQESVKNVSEGSNTPSRAKNMTKMFATNAAKKVLKTIVENVWNIKNAKIQNIVEEKTSNVAKTVYKMDVDVEKATLDKNNDNIITNATIENANIQMAIESEVIMKQEINLIPLPNVDITLSKENKEQVKTQTQDLLKIVRDVNFKENPKQNIENISPTIDLNSNATVTSMEPVKIVVNNDTVLRKETTIKNKEENPQENMENVSEVKGVNTATREKNITNIFENKAAKKVLKAIVENVWETKNDLENTSKTKSETKTENTSKTNITGKKEKYESNISGQHKALTVLLEERMLGYLNKEIKIIKHIHQGKYSNIFSCKDTSGETYAAKILRNQKNRHSLGIQKEQMIRQIQQDIPRENLNTIYLIDGFGIQRYWCFLTEYYPKNLLQALREHDKPFHIDLVQDLARQLISAVMVLRNNFIIHSDIKPKHILLNSSNDRLKLCGFDQAYYGNEDMHPIPNIGTVCYRAPEIIIGFSAGYSIDVWSSALVIYQMATNQILFLGIYNNDILYKQMCTFGNLPRDMVEASFYKHQHFHGRTFKKRVGFKGQNAMFIQKFNKSKRLYMSLFAAYSKYWQTIDVYQRDSDMFKMTALHKLLEQMLQLDPRLRLAIEFVCADPFIYEMFA